MKYVYPQNARIHYDDDNEDDEHDEGDDDDEDDDDDDDDDEDDNYDVEIPFTTHHLDVRD